MPRKSAIVTLCILGAVSLGACCCCTAIIDEDNRAHAQDGGHGGAHGGVWHSTTHYIWYGGWSSTSTRPVGGGVASSRGGFGATGAAHASGG
jgi:hypothetical protein